MQNYRWRMGENESSAVNKKYIHKFLQIRKQKRKQFKYNKFINFKWNKLQFKQWQQLQWRFFQRWEQFGWGGNSGYSNGSFDSYTSGNSFTQAVSDSEGSTSTDSKTDGTTETVGSSKTVTLNFENTGVSNLIKRAQAQLERFKMCESFGMWEFCSYFMSKDIHTTALAGNAYKALMTGKESDVESAHFNIWSLNQEDTIKKLQTIFCILSIQVQRLQLLKEGTINRL